MKVGNRLQTVLVEQYGPIAYSETTTRMDVFDEDMNRCLALSTDESPEQTRRIMRELARRAMNPPASITDIQQRHWALQRLLKRVEVTFPTPTSSRRQFPAKSQKVGAPSVTRSG
jgi:hypothetical protein